MLVSTQLSQQVAFSEGISNGCTSCISAMMRGMSYLPWDMIVHHIKNTAGFHDLCIHIRECVQGDVDGNVSGLEEVHAIDDTKDEVSALYDGHTLQSFEKEFSGVKPSQVGVLPSSELHPVTRE